MTEIAFQSVVPEKLHPRDGLIQDAMDKYGDYDGESAAFDQVILHTSPEFIVKNLVEGTRGWSCERVMIAYIRAACLAHQQTNCLTEIMFEQAIEKARQKDQDRSAGSAHFGPFWGLPSSFKDTYNIIGVDTSLGCSPHCKDPTQSYEDESGLVKLFRRAGGIPFCKTNIPQTLLAFECKNPVFGRSLNPHMKTRGPGGSSGGEAALVTSMGTPLGWGSDIGGSLRIPAHYSGCCGLKPVQGRWPKSGGRDPVPGFEGIRAMVGPMARTVADLAFASKTVISLAIEPDADREERILPIPWREVQLPTRLRVGYFVECGGVKTSPACSRAVMASVDALKRAGHQVEPFEIPDPIEALRVFAALTSADGYKTLLSNLGKDPMEPSMELVTLGSKIPAVLHSFAVWAVRRLLGDHIFSSVFSVSKPKSVKDYWYWTHRRNLWAAKLNKEAWSDKQYDMLLCPVQAVPALEHDRTKLLSPLAIATMLFNVCDSTVGVLPVTRVDREKDELPEPFLHDSDGSWILEKRVYQGSDPAYDASKMHGLPVGVQVVGRAWEEEKVLKMMEVIEGLVKYR